MMSLIRRFSLLLLLLWLLALPLLAAEEAPSDTPSDDEVTVVVTAERAPQPVSASIATTTIITAKKLRETGAQSVADVLRLVPGVNLVQYGTPGSQAVLSIRGSDAKHMLLLVDGQRISGQSFYFGTADLSKFPIDTIARIEVVRGPLSSLYGSEASGGVINIITKTPAGGGGSATLGFGRNGRAERAVNVNGAAGSVLNWQLGASFPAYDGDRPNSDYAATDLTGKLVFPAVRGWALTLHADTYHEKLGLPNADVNHTGYYDPDDRQWWIRRNIGLRASRPLGVGTLEIETYQSLQQWNNLALTGDALQDTRISSRTTAFESVYRRAWGAHQVTLGGEYREDAHRDVETGGWAMSQNNTVRNSALFAQDLLALGARTDLTVGARLDDHSAAGTHVTPRIGITRALAEKTRLRVSYAVGFRAPNFVELYYPGYGNPHLKPETSRQYEIGLNQRWPNDDLDVSVFKIDTNDLIKYDQPYKNIARGAQDGFELSWQHRFPRSTSLDLSYTYVDARSLPDERRMTGQPFNRVTLATSTRVRNWQVSLQSRWFDRRPSKAFDPVTYASWMVMLPSRTIFDLTLQRQSDARVQPYVTVRNLFDTKYEEVVGYPAARFSIETGTRYTW